MFLKNKLNGTSSPLKKQQKKKLNSDSIFPKNKINGTISPIEKTTKIKNFDSGRIYFKNKSRSKLLQL